jgi:hypothetical protein
MNNIIQLNTDLSRNTFGELPDCINYDVVFEPTKVPHKKYVVNGKTGEYLDTVGEQHSKGCVSHPKFFYGVQDAMIEELPQHHLLNAACDFKVARNTAWALMDIKLPEVKVNITTNRGFSTDVSWRAIALHGIDGSCSNQVYFGGIEYFCSNGQISGQWDKVRRKNTSGFNLTYFIDELLVARQAFFEHCKRLQAWANTSTYHWQVKEMLGSLITSERKAERMYALYQEEVAVRGSNVYALYSAMPNYSTYADDRNGFNLNNTGHDTQAVSMWRREHEVSKWVSSNQFAQLVAA